MITKEQLDAAIRQKDEAEKLINAYAAQMLDEFKARLESGKPFTDDELIYAANMLCPCGYGLAYPRNCGPNHYWDCAGILKGIADKNVQHTGQLPFVFWDIKSESQHRGTTRGVFRPRTILQNPEPTA